MSLIDRYIAKSYLTNVVALLVILFSFVVTVDVSLNLNRFARAAAQAIERETQAARAAENNPENTPANNSDPAPEPGTQTTESTSSLTHLLKVVALVADLWWPRLLMLFNFLIGLVMIGAMGFTCAQMVRHSEFVAILASGQSLHRVWKPILLVSTSLIALQAANQQWVLPRIAPLLTRDTGDAGKHDLAAANVPMTVDGDNRVWAARLFDPATETLTDVIVYERTDDGRAIRTLTAPSATWDGGAWVLKSPHLIVHDRAAQKRIDDAASKPTADEPAVATTQPAPDIQPDPATESKPDTEPSAETVPNAAEQGEPNLTIETNLSPVELSRLRFASFSRNLSWSQIGAIIRRNEAQAAQRLSIGDTRAAQRFAKRARDLERVRFGRVSVMLASLLAIVICLPMFVTRVPRNMAIQSLKCAPVALAALMGAMLGAEAPLPGLAPQLAVFLPVLLLAPIAVLTASSVET
jgi:lipopolysaccharide export system permease protein